MEPEKSLVETVISGCADVLLEAHSRGEDGTCRCGERWPCRRAAFALNVLSDADRCKRARAVSLPGAKTAVEYDCILPAGHEPPQLHIWRQR